MKRNSEGKADGTQTDGRKDRMKNVIPTLMMIMAFLIASTVSMTESIHAQATGYYGSMSPTERTLNAKIKLMDAKQARLQDLKRQYSWMPDRSAGEQNISKALLYDRILATEDEISNLQVEINILREKMLDWRSEAYGEEGDYR